jgi:hypothetical protein
VLDYGNNIDFTLLGCIDKKDYSLIPQVLLDVLAEQYSCRRPEYYNFRSMDDVKIFCESNKDIEGFCLYFKNDQHIVKVKTSYYLKLHRLKSELRSYDRVVDFYFENDQPSYTEFYNIVSETLDYEIAEQIRGQISKICDCMKEVNNIVDFMKKYVANNKHKSRKEFAVETIQRWGKTNRQSMVFTLLDGKELDKNQLKKLLYQVGKE